MWKRIGGACMLAVGLFLMTLIWTDGRVEAQTPTARTAFSFEQLTVAATAAGLATATIRPTTNGQIEVEFCSGVLETAPVRYRYDGGTPTSSVGHLLAAGDAFEIEGANNIRNLKLIRTTGSSGTLPLTCH